MTPREIVLEQLNHRETSPVPFHLDFEGDVLKHPEFLEEAYQAGKEMCQAIEMMQQ